MGNHSTGRPHDQTRASKNQPERAVNFARRYLHVCALMQIHKRIASGIRVEGWDLREGLVCRDNGTSEQGADVIMLKELEDEFVWFVLPLDEKLEFPDAKFVVAVWIIIFIINF